MNKKIKSIMEKYKRKIFQLVNSRNFQLFTLLLLLMSLPITLFVSRIEQIYQGRANEKQTCPKVAHLPFGMPADFQRVKGNSSSLPSANRDFALTKHAYKQAENSDKNKQLTLLMNQAKKRKQILIDAMQHNTNLAYQSIAPIEEQLDDQQVMPNCVESPTTIAGTLNIFHSDFQSLGFDDDQYVVTTSSNQKYFIHPAHGTNKALFSGEQVQVTGFGLDNDIIFDGLSNKNFIVRPPKTTAKNTHANFFSFFSDAFSHIFLKANAQAISPIIQTAAHGQLKTVAVLVNNNLNLPSSVTQASVQKLVFGTANSTAASFDANTIVNSLNYTIHDSSYYQSYVWGNTYGGYHIKVNATCDTNTYDDIVNGVIQEITNPSETSNKPPTVDATKYDRVIVFLPFTSGCALGGEAYIGKIKFNTGWNLSFAIINANSFALSSLVHEYGHSLGLDHAGISTCNDPTNSLRCTYQDGYDDMGGDGTFYSHGIHYNAPHKEYLGWLPPSNIKTLNLDNTTTTVTLSPLENITTNLQAVKIPRSTSGDYLYIEYRQPIGIDANLANDLNSAAGISSGSPGTNIFSGSLLHMFLNPPVRTGVIVTNALDPILPDLNAALQDGQTYTDPVTNSTSNTTIKQVSHNARGVTLTIHTATTPFATYNWPPPPYWVYTTPLGDVIAGLDAWYYPNTTLSGTPITRIDSQINTSWGDYSPDPSIPATAFSGAWTGNITPLITDSYTFSVNADNGVRLWVNNQLVIDSWNNQPLTNHVSTNTLPLTAGVSYPIVLEYYHQQATSSPNASVQLGWSSASQPNTIVDNIYLSPVALTIPPPVSASPPPTSSGGSCGTTTLSSCECDFTGANNQPVSYIIDGATCTSADATSCTINSCPGTNSNTNCSVKTVSTTTNNTCTTPTPTLNTIPTTNITIHPNVSPNPVTAGNNVTFDITDAITSQITYLNIWYPNNPGPYTLPGATVDLGCIWNGGTLQGQAVTGSTMLHIICPIGLYTQGGTYHWTITTFYKDPTGAITNGSASGTGTITQSLTQCTYLGGLQTVYISPPGGITGSTVTFQGLSNSPYNSLFGSILWGTGSTNYPAGNINQSTSPYSWVVNPVFFIYPGTYTISVYTGSNYMTCPFTLVATPTPTPTFTPTPTLTPTLVPPTPTQTPVPPTPTPTPISCPLRSPTTNEVFLYTGNNNTGSCYDLTVSSYTVNSSGQPSGYWPQTLHNDDINSVWTGNGINIKLYSDYNYSGSSETIPAGRNIGTWTTQGDLTNYNINQNITNGVNDNQTSSFIISAPPTPTVTPISTKSTFPTPTTGCTTLQHSQGVC